MHHRHKTSRKAFAYIWACSAAIVQYCITCILRAGRGLRRWVSRGRSLGSPVRPRAFTLTELLIVVIVLGVLSAVAVPKFTRVLETRKTTEAESVLSTLRTEQEKRCALGKRYVTDWAPLAASLRPDASSYHFSLQGNGATAGSRGKDYRLKMLSYKDGTLCCEGTYCNSLNKDYPSCDAMSASADECAMIACSGSSSQSCGCQGKGTQSRTCDTNTGTWGNWSGCSRADCKPCDGSGSQSCGCNNTGTQSRSCDPFTGSWSGWGSCSAGPCKSCSGASSQSCGCNNKGSQNRTCDDYTGTWSAWGACSVAECQDCPASTKPAESQACGNCGTQTRPVTCDAYSGTWQTGDWSACSGQGECAAGSTDSSPCAAGYEGQKTRTCSTGCVWSAWDEAACKPNDPCVTNPRSCECSTYYNAHKCQCTPSTQNCCSAQQIQGGMTYRGGRCRCPTNQKWVKTSYRGDYSCSSSCYCGGGYLPYCGADYCTSLCCTGGCWNWDNNGQTSPPYGCVGDFSCSASFTPGVSVCDGGIVIGLRGEF